MGFETSGIMNHVIDANGIINTTFLFSCLGYVFLYFLIYLQKLFFKWNQRYEGENYKRRKKSPDETSGRKCIELEDNFTAWQLDSFLSNALLWHHLTFDSRGSCLVVIFVEVVSAHFSQEVKARKREKKGTSNGKAILYLFWFVSNMRRFQVNSNLSILCFG